GIGVSLFRSQAWIAADQSIVLVRRVGVDAAKLARGNAGVGTLRRSKAVDQPADRRTGAAVDRAAETDRLRCKQFDNVRSTDRAVVARAGQDIRDRGQARLDLVRVGAEVVVRNLVV